MIKLPGDAGFAVDVAIDRSGRWYVTEVLNHPVQVFQSSLTTP